MKRKKENAGAERLGRGLFGLTAAVLAVWSLVRESEPARQAGPDMICKKTVAGWVIASPDFADAGDPDCPPRLAHLLGRPFDVNRAQAEDYERLPAIGPETSARIIRARDEAQGFSGLPDSIPGVSERAMASLRRWTEVSVVESVDE